MNAARSALVVLGELAATGLELAARHARRLSERQQLKQLAHWDRHCMPTQAGPCAVCGEPFPKMHTRCPGPPAAQRARKLLETS